MNERNGRAKFFGKFGKQHFDRAANQKDPQWKKYYPNYKKMGVNDTDAILLKQELVALGWTVQLISTKLYGIIVKSFCLIKNNYLFICNKVNNYLPLWCQTNNNNMKQIHVTLEMGKDGYGVMFKEVPNVFGFGETVDSAKEDANASLKFYIECLEKENRPVPKILQGKYELVFEFDIEALLKYIDGTVTKTALARVAGINPIQLTHYSTGLKKPRPAQREKIITALHQIGKDLLSVS
ncbi:MAG: type II toxin-antitoxin system HicB family antitoxin [Dysgonamonadaceae bacterium]|jgi:predicted RNase H-like HicB family nuclease|nr:type II toxin-antitoxin system HicB family antitoxin [Dysgonamonadaceae bacterium]